jgi:hypothetical protein
VSNPTPDPKPNDPPADPPTPPNPDPPKPDGKTFTQEQVDGIVKDRLERERKTAEAKTQKDREDAEAARLKEQGEFEKLANQRAATITELEAKVTEGETHKTRADRYETALKAHLETQRKDLPAHITALLDRMDPVDQLEYIAANREALGAKPGQNGSGIPATPKPGDRKALTEEQQQAAQRQAAQLVKSRF